MATPLTNSKKSVYAYACIGAVLILCFTGQIWISPLEKLAKANFFLTANSLHLIGISVFFTLLAPWLVPKSFLCHAQQLGRALQKRGALALILFLPLLLLGIIYINQKVLLSFLNSADEHSCYFAAECIRLGKWWVKPHALSEFFNVVHVGNRDGKWFSVYPPGWPLIWAFGISFHIADWLNPLISISALAFIFLSARKIYGPTIAVLGIFFTAITPYFTFTAASYFSHSTCLLAVSLFIYSYLRWMEAKSPRDRFLWASICAFAGGYGLLTRYLTMAAIMSPFILNRVQLIFRKKERLDSADISFAVILGMMMLLVLGHNYAVTGKLFKAPNKYDKSWERLGFKGQYSILEGLFNIIFRFFYLMDWAPPIWIPAFIYICLTQQTSCYKSIFKSLFWWNAFAYFLYYSWGGNQYGPRYYYEAYPFLILTVLDVLQKFWSVGNENQKKYVFSFLFFALVSAPFQFRTQTAFFYQNTAERKALYQLADASLLDPSIVFIKGPLGSEWPLSEDDAVRNRPALDSKVLYAHDKGEDNSRLIASYPNRKAYRGWFDRTTKSARLEAVV